MSQYTLILSVIVQLLGALARQIQIVELVVVLLCQIFFIYWNDIEIFFFFTLIKKTPFKEHIFSSLFQNSIAFLLFTKMCFFMYNRYKFGPRFVQHKKQQGDSYIFIIFLKQALKNLHFGIVKKKSISEKMYRCSDHSTSFFAECFEKRN